MMRSVLLFCSSYLGFVSSSSSSSPSLVSSQLLFDVDKEVFPMVIQAAVVEGEGEFFCLGQLPA